VNHGRLLERLRRLASFDVANHLPHAATDVVINHETRILAQARCCVQTRRVLLAAERTHHKKPPALQRRNTAAQSDATNDRAESHTRTPGSRSSTTPMTSQRTGLFSSPTALRAAAPSDEITTCWCIPAPCESIATCGVPSGCPSAL